MSKGIRPFCNAKFVELLPTRVNSREGNIVFRKSVMFAVTEAFNVSVPSAATHYNHAFIEARKDAALAPLLVGLGRPEDKKGGRKPKAVVPALDTTMPWEGAHEYPVDEEAAARGPLTPAPFQFPTAASMGTADELTATENLQGDVRWPHADGYIPSTYTVTKKDGTIVAQGATKAEADALVAKAKASKKGTLQVQEVTA